VHDFWQQLNPREVFSDFPQRSTEAQLRGNRCEDIATMKSATDLWGEQTAICYLKCFVVGGLPQHEGKDAVVWSHKAILTGLCHYRSTR
jgi:hypothetical protein